MTQKVLCHRSRPNLFIQTIRHTWTEFKSLDGEMDLRWTKPKPPMKEVKMSDTRFIGYTFKARIKLFVGIVIERVPKTIKLSSDEKNWFDWTKSDIWNWKNFRGSFRKRKELHG